MGFWIDTQVVKHCEKKIHAEIFAPNENIIVLGSSNDPEREVNVDEATQRGVPIHKRAGGGGTVVLYSGCIVVSVGMWVENPFENQFYFQRINEAVGNFLGSEAKSPLELTQRGLSDIALGEKKIGGTSLFRSRQYLLYQASLIFELDVELIAALLQHPSKEPDYRQGRDHREFLTELRPFFAAKCAEDLSLILNKKIDVFLKLLEPFASAPEASTIPHLQKRFNS